VSRRRERVRRTHWDVVLAEDDDDYAIVVERALERISKVPVELRRARTGTEALALLRSSVPDLLLLDLKMPGMAGHETLDEIKADEVLRSIPVAVLTSSDRDDDVAKTYGLGGNHFITKPNNPLELEAKLSTLLRNLPELGEGSSGVVGFVGHGGQRGRPWLDGCTKMGPVRGGRGGVARLILLRKARGGFLEVSGAAPALPQHPSMHQGRIRARRTCT